MKDTAERLKILKIRENELLYLKTMAFNDIDAANAFFDKNNKLFEKLKEVREEIRKLEWQSKSDAEKKNERIELIAFVQKYIAEGQNNQKNEYMQAYLQVVDLITKMKESSLIDATTKGEFDKFIETLQQEKFWGIGKII